MSARRSTDSPELGAPADAPARAERWARALAHKNAPSRALTCATVAALLVLLPFVLLVGPARFEPWVIRRWRYARIAESTEPLVQAIEQYAADQGSPPASLGALVPRYLERLPSSALSGGDLDYEVASPSLVEHGYPAWCIRISAGRGLLNFDEFLYEPGQAYPEHRSHERIGKWCYIHE